MCACIYVSVHICMCMYMCVYVCVVRVYVCVCMSESITQFVAINAVCSEGNLDI